MLSLWVALLAANKIRRFAARSRHAFIGMWLPMYQVRALAKWMPETGPHAEKVRAEASKDESYRIGHFGDKDVDALAAGLAACWPLSSKWLGYLAPLWPGRAWFWLVRVRQKPKRIWARVVYMATARRRAMALAEWKRRDTRPIWEAFEDSSALESVEFK